MSSSEGGVREVEAGSGQPRENPPEGAPQRGQDSVDDSSGYPETTTYRVRNTYISDVDGPAVHVGADSVSADAVVENVHIDGATYGVIADGVTVVVRDCEIVADEPFGTVNGGRIEEENTNTGSDANPSPPSQTPSSAEEAAGSDTQIPE